jgi:hypothetical protein
LFKAIEGFEKTTDMVRMLLIDKSRGLLTIDHFIEMTMEEGIFDVELMNGPSVREGKRENDANGSGFNYRAEGFIKVDAGLLREAAYHPTGFVTGKRTIGVIFVAKNPFSAHNVGTRWGRDKSPSLVMCECVVLFLHGLPPVRITKS